MIKNKHIVFFIILFIQTSLTYAETLSISVSGLKNNQGKLYIAIYGKAEEFTDGIKFSKKIINSQKENVTTTFKLIKGQYAIAVFQDKNNNGILDKNIFGIPNEPYGFSGKKVFGAPTFDDSAIELNNNKSIQIQME